MRNLMIAAVLLAGTAAPAMAQDQVNPQFTGPRVGVTAGYDILRPGSSEDADIDGVNENVDGFNYGVELGYDFSIGGAVLGVEAELADSTAKQKTSTNNPDFLGFGEVAAGRDIYVGVRAGVLAAPSTLIYAKGGYTNARLNVLASDGTTELRENFDLEGWRLGAGIEQAIGTNTFAKLEYRYSNYSNANFEYRSGATTENFDIDTDRHQIVAGVGIRF
ncbi:outer membrane protein [Sphingomonas turrisvirgatae]|uniref:Outer membrane protein beta-barrel domain-containing protein n=1 Tax=Sphingomonas turrisvirgatae TaxID=1888892 RepID=A0A1E3M108_9SPHN|nr:outer membrane beta-barrel protein [Sphingomonas turrisvirgatae]ODP39653.1 hypothetical protein BFL28_08420 [Sphingomonas turrisvirgatae]